MPLPTNSTLTTVKAQLVTLFTTALATSSPSGGQVQVAYAWPGPDTEPEAVFFGSVPTDARPTDDATTTATLDIPNIKAGRKQRDETYELDITMWTFRPDLTAAAAQEVEERAEAICDELEDVLADDPKLGLDGVVKVAKIVRWRSTPIPYENGWACVRRLTVEVFARLR